MSIISTASVSKKIPDLLGSYGGWTTYIDTIKDVKVSGIRVKQVRVKEPLCPNGFIDQLEIEGIINEDTSFIVESLLKEIHNGEGSCDQQPRIVTLHSEGGYIIEGMYLGKVFNDYSVITALLPGHKCSSACSLAFIGGVYRYMGPDTELMVHTPYLNKGSSAIECMNWDDDASIYLASYIKTMLAEKDWYLFWEKTMTNCGLDVGWTINADAAKIYGITNMF